MNYKYESKAKIEYTGLLESGMFFEFYPKLTGDWDIDKDEWKVHYKELSKFRSLYKQFQESEDIKIVDFYTWIGNQNKNLSNIFTWKK